MSAIIYGEDCVERICFRSNIVVCMPLVFRVRAVMDGLVYVVGSRESIGDNGVWMGLGLVRLDVLG
jgi:hypothetical protein